MVRLHLSTFDLTRTRFAYSPLWETVMGYRAMCNPSRFAIHLPWICEAVASTKRLELGVLAALIRPSGYVPDFMTPPPFTPVPDFEAELRAMLQTNEETVRREVLNVFEGQIERVPEAALGLLTNTPQALIDLATTLHAFWAATLEPHWPRFRAMLENDIALNAISLARSGAQALFQDFNPLLRYDSGVLCLDESLFQEQDRVVYLGGRGLLLMPSAFVWPSLNAILDEPWQPTFVYSARGVAELWATTPPSASQALASMLGKGRAEVLLSLEPPSSTTDVARRLSLAASSVSEHLSALRQAGLVESQRRGRMVYYRLSSTGASLLELLNRNGHQTDI